MTGEETRVERPLQLTPLVPEKEPATPAWWRWVEQELAAQGYGEEARTC